MEMTLWAVIPCLKAVLIEYDSSLRRNRQGNESQDGERGPSRQLAPVPRIPLHYEKEQ